MRQRKTGRVVVGRRRVVLWTYAQC
uniref:Uncharacterized protein n=1 Tax=Arundo donax TaxID=35708 RepID=A0A0A9BD87_ARUDO